MRTLMGLLLALSVNLLMSQSICMGASEPFLAYSMREAERRMKMTRAPGSDVTELGGITRLVGAVYDTERDDLVLVGQVVPDGTRLSLDDLVVALRSRFLHDTWPEVSIEKRPGTTSRETQTVRYEGGIEHTHLGKCFLEADVILKKVSLGLLPTDIWDVRSYFDMAVEQQTKDPEENMSSTRFWFSPVKRYSVAVRPGVVALNDLRIHVKAQLEGTSARVDGSTVQKDMRNEVADRFAQSLTDAYGDLCAAYAEVGALKPVMDLIAVAKGVEDLEITPAIAYWIDEYAVAHVETLQEYPLLKRESRISHHSETFVFQVDGGIAARAAMSRLTQEGDITAIRDLVCMSRPSESALTWKVPLDGWTVPGYDATSNQIGRDEEYGTLFESGSRGCTIGERLFAPGGADAISPIVRTEAMSARGWSYARSDFNVAQRLSIPKYSNRVGGVMLQGMAQVDGARSAQLDLNSGNFSLVVDGQNARLSPGVFRKFVTALWSVYYSNQDPGISIDPIAPGIDKHMVRYIGKVINTDLGRVMREADYLMKTWSVGTARPDIRGFQSPDDVSGRRGYAYLGASRFWFVPQDMRFKRAGELLLFDSGQMTVQTEYLFDNGTGMNADPANEQFADFLTTRYSEFAKRYPVLQELFDYAKMVSLAKYLKESGVPLYWFLMANKDLVLTEDSPGTVEALAKGSDYFKNLRIEGGVDLGVESNYVYDAEAVRAIWAAASRYGSSTSSTSTASYRVREVPAVGRSFSFDLDGRGYSVVPQHSLTSGKDSRGIRYQTDFALRARGFKLTEESWEALKYDVTRRAFARRWNPLVEKMSEAELEREGKRLYQETLEQAEQQVARDLENLKDLAGKKFDREEAFTRAVERALGSTCDPNIVQLAKKHAYYQTDLEVVRFFDPKRRKDGQFGEGWQLLIPYQVRPHGTAKRDFLNVRIPEKMAVENLITHKREILTFSTDRYKAAGYVPEEIESSQVVGLFIMTDASYRLVDKLGNEFRFDPAGYLTEMAFSRNHRVSVEYLDSAKDAFEESPYRLRPGSRECVRVLSVMVPKVMTVSDLVNDSSEEFVFTEEIAAYIPRSGVKSRFEVLSLMTDRSFRLRDKQGNKIDFGPDGRFAAFDSPFDTRMVKSISAGPYRVDFNYTLGFAGQMLIAGARLSEGSETDPLYAVDYDYDQEGRLCRARRSDPQQARLDESEQKVLLVAKD